MLPINAYLTVACKPMFCRAAARVARFAQALVRYNKLLVTKEGLKLQIRYWTLIRLMFTATRELPFEFRVWLGILDLALPDTRNSSKRTVPESVLDYVNNKRFQNQPAS